jgi:hypothetical protein
LKSLEKLKKVLSDVEINEEQKSALDEFFAELYENLQEKAREEVQEELEFMNEALDGTGSKEGWIRVEEAEEAFNRGMLDAERAFNALSQEYDIAMEKAEKAFNLLSNDYDLAMENAEKAFNLGMEDAEKAFNLFSEDSEAAFNLAMEDSEKAFTLVQEDLIKEHSETMSKAMEHLYETLLEKAKEEIYESQDFSVIKQIKEILAPVILQESNSTTLMTRVRELEKQLSLAKQEKVNSEKDQIIESLVDELPIKEAKIVRNYISEANSIQDVYERYNLAISLLEAKEDREESHDEDTISNKKSFKEEKLSESTRKPTRNFRDFFEANEEDDEEDFEEIDELEDEESSEVEFEFQTEETVFSSNSKEKPKTDKFNSFEEAIISSVFKK